MKTTKPTLKRAGIFILVFAYVFTIIALAFIALKPSTSATSYMFELPSPIAIASSAALFFVAAFLLIILFPQYKSEVSFGIVYGAIFGLMLALIL